MEVRMKAYRGIPTIILCVVFVFCIAAPVFTSENDSSQEQTGGDKAGDEPESKGKSAADIVKSADRAVSYAVKLARESKDPALASDNEDAEPFWQALKKTNEAVDKMDRGIFLKDETFFTALAQATSAVEELKITYGMSTAKDEAVIEGVERIDAAVSLLRENYSKEAVRLEKGGELTAEEKKQLDAIKDKQAELQRKLTEVEGKIGKNETMIQGIRDIRSRSNAISSARYDVHGFVYATAWMNMMNGWLWGWHWWWGPYGAWCPPYSMGAFNVYVDAINIIDYDYLLFDDYIDIGDIDIDIPDVGDLPDVEAELMDEAGPMDDAGLGAETMDEPGVMDDAGPGATASDEIGAIDGPGEVITYEGLEGVNLGDVGFDVPVQPMDEFTYEAMDEYLHQSDFTISNDEMMDFSYDELQYEGAMDVHGISDFQSFDFGDFDPPGMDFDAPDVFID
jgi:hypothetical protein